MAQVFTPSVQLLLPHIAYFANLVHNVPYTLHNTALGDFPGGPVVKNPPYNAGDAGSIPGQVTKIPRAAGQLSPRNTITELAGLN